MPKFEMFLNKFKPLFSPLKFPQTLSSSSKTSQLSLFILNKSTMSAKSKRKDDASDADSDGNAPPKKSAKHNDEDGILVCELSKSRRVTVRSWQGKVVVDIREFYTKDGKELPGRKGISLTMDQWKILRDHAEDIDQAVAEN